MKKVRGSVKYICMMVLCMCLFWGNSMTADAKTNSYQTYTKIYGSKLNWVFDPVYYAKTYPDVANNAYFGKNNSRLFEHYVDYGIREGRWGTKDFNCRYYVLNYPDLRNLYGICDELSCGYEFYMKHYMNYGKAEQRTTNRLVGYQSRTDKHLMSMYTIKFNPNADIKRTENIVQAVTLLNGVIVLPGQDFSFTNTVMSGFKEHMPLYHKASCDMCKANIVGGGICYVGSAVESAFAQAGFTAKNRNGGECDSSIHMNQKLIYNNYSGKPILVEAYADKYNGAITVAVYYLD